jgi:plasmid stabilization system protein ParE
MSLQVRVSERAERDVDAIFEWLVKHPRDGALRWYEAYLNSDTANIGSTESGHKTLRTATPSFLVVCPQAKQMPGRS